MKIRIASLQHNSEPVSFPALTGMCTHVCTWIEKSKLQLSALCRDRLCCPHGVRTHNSGSWDHESRTLPLGYACLKCLHRFGYSALKTLLGMLQTWVAISVCQWPLKKRKICCIMKKCIFQCFPKYEPKLAQIWKSHAALKITIFAFLNRILISAKHILIFHIYINGWLNYSL